MCSRAAESYNLPLLWRTTLVSHKYVALRKAIEKPEELTHAALMVVNVLRLAGAENPVPRFAQHLRSEFASENNYQPPIFTALNSK